MKWFKHEADASQNKKVRKLKRMYGAEGYAVYFQIAEFIAEDIEKDNVNDWGFLPHEYDDMEFLADEVGIEDVEKLKEIIEFCCSNPVNLFEKREGRIYCERVLEQADEYTQKLIKQAKGNLGEKSGESEAKEETESEVNRDSIGSKSGDNQESVGHKKKKEKENQNEKKKENEKEEKDLKKSIAYLSSFPLEDFAEIDITEKQLRLEAQKALNWLKSEGKRKKDYQAFFVNWILRNYKMKSEVVLFPEHKKVPPEQRVSNEKMQQLRQQLTGIAKSKSVNGEEVKNNGG